MKVLITISDTRTGEVDCVEIDSANLANQVEYMINEGGHDPDELRIWKRADISIEVRKTNVTLFDLTGADVPVEGE
jgi:hypothetical protein